MQEGGAARLAIGVAYLIGHYALFRHLTGSWPAAALGPLGACAVRNSLGGEYWGFGGLPRRAAPGHRLG